jgi:hypothetical protein
VIGFVVYWLVLLLIQHPHAFVGTLNQEKNRPGCGNSGGISGNSGGIIIIERIYITCHLGSYLQPNTGVGMGN